MQFLQTLSDDQIALLGCFAALSLAFGMMFVSHYIGQSKREKQLAPWLQSDKLTAAFPESRRESETTAQSEKAA